MTHLSRPPFPLWFDVPFGELSTMVVQPSDLLEEPVLVFSKDDAPDYVFNWRDERFEEVVLWPTQQV